MKKNKVIGTALTDGDSLVVGKWSSMRGEDARGGGRE